MLEINKTKLIGFYKLTRVRTIMDFYPFLVIFGILSTRTYINLLSIVVSVSILLLLIGSFIINDIEDSEDDAKDPKKVNRNPISAGIISKKEGYLFYIATNVVALLPLLFINNQIFLVGTLAAIIGYVYSCLPLRLKSRPIVDILSHGFFLAGVQVIMYALLPDNLTDSRTLIIFVGLYLFSMGGDLYNEVRDWKVDREVGLKNSASFLGFNLARYVSYLFYIVGVLLITIASILIVFKIN